MSCQDSKTTKQNIAQSKNIEKTELNPDYDNFMKDLEKLLQSQSELIIGFEAIDNSVDYYHVTVSDLWFEASNIEKERYVNTFYKSLYYTLVKNEIISENTSIFIYFYDSYGIELAKPTMTGFKILK